ncbi:MAG: hypothetical protein ACRERU_13345 [Methylococcales bacterium]
MKHDLEFIAGPFEAYSEIDEFTEEQSDGYDEFEFECDFENGYDSFEYEEEFGDELEFETRNKCKRDWCSPNYIQWVQKSLNQRRRPGKNLEKIVFMMTTQFVRLKVFKSSMA